MAIKLSTAVRNARLDTIESNIGTSVTLKVFTGTDPANCAAANSGTELVAITLPSDWMNAAASGSKDKSASAWTGTAGATGTPGYFRIYNSTVTFDGTTCSIQGTAAVGSGDMNFNGSITSGQTITVSSFSLTDGNA